MSDLLPINATKLEHVLANMAVEKIKLPANIADLWNADKCPVFLLPWLAHSLSVDYWDDDWFEAVKRRVIKMSVANHAIKGTGQSIKNALAILGIIAEVTPWHEAATEKPKFSFEVIAWVNEQIKTSDFIINPELNKQARVMIDNHKSLRDDYVLKVGSQHDANYLIRSRISSAVYAEFTGATYVPEYENNLNIASMASGAIYAEFTGASI